jgi:pimeloyl-ACP methyl ester carboxylesterase
MARSRVLAVVLAAVLSVGGPTPASAGGADPSRPKVAPSARTPVAGHVVRPLDPAEPTGRTIRIGYELYPATDGPSRGTVLAIEGGPGYATTDSRDYYLDLFRPLLDHRDLLLIDARGTGTSGAIRCPELQAYEGPYLRAVAACGRQLGDASDLYGSAFAADDFVAVLDRLGVDRVDVYGDSYGTFLGQTFAIRHPDRVRTVTLDAAYPVAGQHPWYPDLNRAMRSAFRLVCERDPSCQGDPIRRFRRAADLLRDRPLTGSAFDADGTRRRVRVDPGELAYVMGVATYGTTVYQELDAAVRAWRHGDPAPLLRIVAEQGSYGSAGPVRSFSQGAYVSVICNDYPQLWDISAPRALRRQQYDARVARLERRHPQVFSPFTVDDWLSSDWTEYASCRPWPSPSHWVPPVEEPVTYPDVPVLVLVGDLDSITSAEGAGIVADHFPSARFVEVANVGHVTALGDYAGCASVVVRRFVRTRDPGDTSCARDANPRVRLVERFPRSWRGFAVPAGRGLRSDRRVATAAVHTLGDLFPRWYAMYGGRGKGLRGGGFTTTGLVQVDFRLHRMRLVGDLAVSGHLHWSRPAGTVSATVVLGGGHSGRLLVRWDDASGRATARGRVDGRHVAIRLRAP